MRLYVPCSPDDLARLAADPAALAGAARAAAWADTSQLHGDDAEEAEYEAMQTAAQAGVEKAPAQDRIAVAAYESPNLPGASASTVTIPSRSRLVSVHVSEKAAGALHGEEAELLWFDVSELDAAARYLGSGRLD